MIVRDMASVYIQVPVKKWAPKFEPTIKNDLETFRHIDITGPNYKPNYGYPITEEEEKESLQKTSNTDQSTNHQ